jgi:hypothetical protein
MLDSLEVLIKAGVVRQRKVKALKKEVADKQNTRMADCDICRRLAVNLSVWS